LANLLASRAVLEGFGVGKESASATDAILVSVAQDVVSRLTSKCPPLRVRPGVDDINSDHLCVLAGHVPVSRGKNISLFGRHPERYGHRS
jgi:hypothetical protein